MRDQTPAVFYITDRKAGGILVNAPCFDLTLFHELSDLVAPRFLFLPSHYGIHDLAAWRATGIETLAFGEEIDAAEVDIRISSEQKLTRTIDFLPMAGRTRGTCGLRLKSLPGVLFLGPALTPGEDGWPQLVPEPNDYSYESRLMGVFGLRDLSFEYVFTDVFVLGQTQFGPRADKCIRAHLDALLET